jgi:hypothetical protein
MSMAGFCIPVEVIISTACTGIVVTGGKDGTGALLTVPSRFEK